MDTGLRDRVAIVAASSQGLGRACAEGFAAEGCHLALCARTEKTLSETSAAIRDRYKVTAFERAFDVTDSSAVQAFVAAVAEKFGRIDICVTNAGGPPAKNFLSVSLEEWRRAVELNFLSTVAFCQAVIPHMQKRKWGRIITITSVSVKQPIADLIMSNSVRSAVVGLVKSLSNEFGKDGILVNNVGPGFTATDRLKSLAATRALAAGVSADQMMTQFASATALQRVGEPREFADAVVFLASERASYITGQTVLVDGGAYKGL